MYINSHPLNLPSSSYALNHLKILLKASFQHSQAWSILPTLCRYNFQMHYYSRKVVSRPGSSLQKSTMFQVTLSKLFLVLTPLINTSLSLITFVNTQCVYKAVGCSQGVDKSTPFYSAQIWEITFVQHGALLHSPDDIWRNTDVIIALKPNGDNLLA